MGRVNSIVLLLFLCSLLTIVTTQTDCGLAGFSLSDLSTNAWWKVPLTSIHGCVFAETNGSFVNSDCDFYFSICHGLRDLPECNTNGDWSVCQKGTFNNVKESANIANYKPINESGIEINKTNQVGFEVFYTAKAAVTSICSNATVALRFHCDKQAIWTPTETGGNVPNGIDTYSFIYSFVDKICKYQFNFNYSGACYSSPPINPSTCYIARYKYQHLVENTYWKVDEFANFDVCLTTNSCNIFFRLCNLLPQEISAKCGPYSGICINNEGTFYNLGNYDNSTVALIERSDKIGFMAVYKGGDSEFLGCTNDQTLTTTLNFICNSTAVWKNDQTEHHAELPYKVDYDKNKCTAVYNFFYNGSCVITPINPPIVQPSGIGVPVLFILVFIVLFLFSTYWVVGSVFNISSGKRGVKIIPNYHFWKELCRLFVGGFLFIFRLFSCKEAAKGDDNEEEPIVKKGYQSIDDTENPFGK